ncbi:uncharacterized protein LOC134668635 [Cydia fagiglandana]|uniref:uncharacterized protein LOC134668635 n=1 Tax=Cydia fagiglandana TaxID=1458189 RepID=UPI002FEDF37B
MDILASQHSKKDFRSFWKSTNNMNLRPGDPVSVDGKSNVYEIANHFKDHFFVKSPLGPSQAEVSNAEIKNDRVEPGYTAKQITSTIRSMSRGKSPGHDGLSIEHLQNAGPHISRVLAMFYTLCVRHCYLPEDLMKTIVIPVVKSKTGDLSDSSNYRPISLATIVAKVLDSVLNAQLNSLWKDYTQRAYGALRIQYNNAFRVLVGLPRFCSASGMFAEARMDCFYATIRKRCSSLVRRVRASPNPILRSIADRRGANNLEKLVETGKVEGKRSRGRSPKRWSDQISEQLELPVTTALHQASDRNIWRQFIKRKWSHDPQQWGSD